MLRRSSGPSQTADPLPRPRSPVVPSAPGQRQKAATSPAAHPNSTFHPAQGARSNPPACPLPTRPISTRSAVVRRLGSTPTAHPYRAPPPQPLPSCASACARPNPPATPSASQRGLAGSPSSIEGTWHALAKLRRPRNGKMRPPQLNRSQLRRNVVPTAKRPARSKRVIDKQSVLSRFVNRRTHILKERRRSKTTYALLLRFRHGRKIKSLIERLDLRAAKTGLVQHADLAAQLFLCHIVSRPPPPRNWPILLFGRKKLLPDRSAAAGALDRLIRGG